MSRFIECDRCGKRHIISDTPHSRSDPPQPASVARIALTKDTLTFGVSADLCESCLEQLIRFMREPLPKPKALP